MYRCKEVSQEQQRLQTIIWRHTSTEKLREYGLCTVTYGMECALWFAMRTLKQQAIDEAAAVLKSEFHFDDLVNGHNSVP